MREPYRPPRRRAPALLLFFLPLLTGGCVKEPGEIWEPGRPLAKELVRIGIIHPNRIDESSGYDFAHYQGTQEMERFLGLKEGQIIRKLDVFEEDEPAVEAAIRDCISLGANIIIAASWGYMDVCEELAVEFPRVVFAHATGYKRNELNFTNYAGRLYQARYLSGLVAGLKTKTGKIGYVAAMGKDNSEVTGGINAFAIGVEAVNPGARVHVRLTHNWFDPMGETVAAERLIASGCDVIAQHCNTSSPMLAAERAGVWGIGFNSDMREDAPGAVITSVVIYWGLLYTQLVESVINGTFRSVPHFYGLAEGVVDISPLAEELAAPGTAEAVEAARDRILRGGFNVFDGPLLANDGRIIGEEGKTLSDEEILRGMDWYYRTAIEDRP